MKVALFKPLSFIDKLVCFFSRGKYSHIAILFDDGSSIEAVPFKGVIYNKNLIKSRNKNQIIEVYNIKTTTKQDRIIKYFLERQLGKGYDYLSVLGFIINKTDVGRKEYGKWFCSELVYSAFRKAEIELLERIHQWETTPVLISYSNKLS